MDSVDAGRVRLLNQDPPRGDGGYVLYWMTAARRLHWNFALDRAVDWSRELNKPLVILEGLSLSYPWASARLHRFAMDGMVDKASRRLPEGVRYISYVEPTPRAGRGLVESLASKACLVVSDDFPCFFLPRVHRAAAARVSVAFESVDGNGLVPMRAANRTFTAAYHFRRFLQKCLLDHLVSPPSPDALKRMPRVGAPVIDEGILERWPSTDVPSLGSPAFLEALEIDQSVVPSDIVGGETAARARMKAFLDDGFARYREDRNHPDRRASSSLSPYLHWGHISTHEIFSEIGALEGWSPLRLGSEARGRREGWWGMSPSAEAFLDQLITWRELGFNMCVREEDFDRFESLPAWARGTLEAHGDDPRPWTYDLAAFGRAETHDPLWNAAQRELAQKGTLHNYLRMLWGKKILEWSPDPRTALDTLIELNNRYALDGRDPNSYSGIFWTLGRYDRGWPTRPVFGTVRSMSSEATMRKVEVTTYLEQFS